MSHHSKQADPNIWKRKSKQKQHCKTPLSSREPAPSVKTGIFCSASALLVSSGLPPHDSHRATSFLCWSRNGRRRLSWTTNAAARLRAALRCLCSRIAGFGSMNRRHQPLCMLSLLQFLDLPRERLGWSDARDRSRTTGMLTSGALLGFRDVMVLRLALGHEDSGSGGVGRGSRLLRARNFLAEV